jgi:insulin receptor
LTGNQEKLTVQIVSYDNTSVTIRWNNFRRNLKETNHLLNYEVFYKEAPQRDVSLYEDRDPCGYDDWKVMDVPKLDHKGAQEDEPEWEHERLISGLKHYTQYALYVKTVVIPDETSPNNNTGAQSDLIYFTSLPGRKT